MLLSVGASLAAGILINRAWLFALPLVPFSWLFAAPASFWDALDIHDPAVGFIFVAALLCEEVALAMGMAAARRRVGRSSQRSAA